MTFSTERDRAHPPLILKPNSWDRELREFFHSGSSVETATCIHRKRKKSDALG